MKITVKTTQQKVFHVDVEPSDSVGILKDKISTEHGHAVAAQKIIYSGKILTDEKTIESCGIKEKDFLVLMVSKPKPTPAPAPATTSSTPAAAAASSAPEPAPAPAPAPVPVPAAAAPAAAAAPPEPAPAPAAAAAATSAGDSSGFLTGDALQNTINNMVEMGFPRDEVLRAMRAAFNNPDRATEYLMTGIPESVQAELAPPPIPAQLPHSPPASAAAAAATAPATNQPQNLFQLAQQQQQQQHQTRGGAAAAAAGVVPGLGGAAGAPGGPLSLDGLANLPQIIQIRQLLEERPELAGPLVQQLAASNPQLAGLLAQNPDALMQLLGIDLNNLEFGAEEGDAAAGIPPGATTISVTPEERAAIDRLQALGFSQEQAITAYLTCDKNEEMAANMLFEGAFDD